MNTIYLLGPIIAQSKKDMTEWRTEAADTLRPMGYRVLCPLTGESFLWPKKEINTKSSRRYPAGVGRMTFNADRARVWCADIILGNFRKAQVASIGSVSELAWAHGWYKLVIAVMGQRNVHRHPWVKEIIAGPIFSRMSEAYHYLEMLAQDGIDPAVRRIETLTEEVKDLKDQFGKYVKYTEKIFEALKAKKGE